MTSCLLDYLSHVGKKGIYFWWRSTLFPLWGFSSSLEECFPLWRLPEKQWRLEESRSSVITWPGIPVWQMDGWTRLTSTEHSPCSVYIYIYIYIYKIYVCVYIYIYNIIYIDLSSPEVEREEGREDLEREQGKKSGSKTLMWVRNIDWWPFVHALTRDWTCNLGMCSDQESNPWPFCLWDDDNQLSHTGWGKSGRILKLYVIFFLLEF